MVTGQQAQRRCAAGQPGRKLRQSEVGAGRNVSGEPGHLGGLDLLQQLGGGASALSLLTGDHSVRVWQSGQDQSRVALLDTFAETEVVLSGSDVWTYDSTKNAVTHVRLPDRAAPNAKSAPADGSPAEGSPFGGAEALTPADAAAKVLAAIDPTTQVTVGEAATVAGRSAYELRVSPRST